MNQFDKILQKLDVKIQNLSKNGENNNGKIDTTKEKDQLAKLLAGAEQELDDLYSKVYYGNNDDYDSDKKVLIRHHYSKAEEKLSQYKNFLKNLICGYESINDDNGTASVTKRKDVKIIKEFQIGEDNKCIATLKKNMCNKATLELVRRIKENFIK